MKLSLDTKRLASSLSCAQVTGDSGMFPDHPPIASLRTIRNSVQICVSAGNIHTTLNLDADVAQAGDVVVPAEPFARLAQYAPGKRISFEVHEELHGREIVAESAGLIVRLSLPESEPWRPPRDLAHEIALDDTSISRLARILFAASRKSNTPAYRGVLFDHGIAATSDGYRAAIAHGIPFDGQIVVPIELVEHFVKHQSGACYLQWSDAWVRLISGPMAWASATMSVTYPRVLDVIPEPSESFVECDRTEMLRAIHRTTVIPGGRDSARAVFIMNEEGDAGSVWSEVEGSFVRQSIEMHGSVDWLFCMNTAYLQDALGCLESFRVRIEMAGALRPARLSDNGVTTVIMPLSTPETRKSSDI